MNEEDLLAQLWPGEALHMRKFGLPIEGEMPIFFEPLDAAAIARANEAAWLVGIVLDGDGPIGQEWIAKIHAWAKMPPRNTAHFGAAPYYLEAISK